MGEHVLQADAQVQGPPQPLPVDPGAGTLRQVSSSMDLSFLSLRMR